MFITFFIQATLKVYKQLKDEYFGLVRQAGELDLQLNEMKVAENLFVFFVLNSRVCCDVNCFLAAMEFSAEQVNKFVSVLPS